MKTFVAAALSLLAGIVIGAMAVPRLQAEAIRPVYTVSEIQISNVDAYMKEFAPLVGASITNSGGKLLAAGVGTSLEGAPTTRIAIQSWDSAEQARAWRSGAEYRKAREIGDKYANFRAFIIEAR